MARSSRLQSVLVSIVGSTGFRSDASELAGIPEQDFNDLVTKFKAAGGFLGPAGIRKLAGHLPLDQQNALASIVLNLVSLRRELKLKPTDLADSLTAALEKKPGAFEPPIPDRLRILAGSFPAVERQAKAESLANLLGPTVVSARVVCDLRPVFNEERDQIEGFLPISTLRIGLSSSDAFEAQLSPLQLRRLRGELDQAMQKMDILTARMRESGEDIPELGEDDE